MPNVVLKPANFELHLSVKEAQEYYKLI